MKVISLNTWGGAAGPEKLLKFVESNKDAEVFCFQETWNGGEEFLEKGEHGIEHLTQIDNRLFENVQKTLQTHNGYFRPQFRDFFGLAMFVRNDVCIVDEGEIFVYKERGYEHPDSARNHSRNLQYISIEKNGETKVILNLHGLWNGQGKTDSADRLEQSDNMLEFVQNLSTPYVLCGDFNLLPETESLKKLERAGLRNLIAENNITSTRTSLYKKEIRFADYIFVSDGVQVNNFQVLPDEVSDHSPLLLEFE